MTTDELTALQTKLEAECACALKAGTRPVFGHGNPNAEVVFIGEAPGAREEADGIPFVGAAGKFLDEMLGTIGMKREDIYITNVVKYRPPNNRDPEPEEKEACRAWLHAELQAIAPKLIIFLGRHSMNDFFPDLRISDAHGKLIKKKFIWMSTSHFLPLYHPAAALYNGGMRDVLIADFSKIPKILKMIENAKD